MEHKLWYDELNQIVKLSITGKVNENEARRLLNQADKLYEGLSYPTLLCDLSRGVWPVTPKGTRRVLRERGVKIGLKRIAFLGMSPSLRMVAMVVTSIWKASKTTKFFKTEAQALAWLKEEK